jgi:zinc protease
MVALVATLPAGSAYDPANKPGLASFAASLIDEGAGTMDAKAFHKALADHAIQFRASVERDYMTVSIVTLTENLPLAMHLMQMALTHPRFDADAIRISPAISSTAIPMGMPPPAIRSASAISPPTTSRALSAAIGCAAG